MPRSVLGLVALLAVVTAAPAAEQEWGTVKGRIVWAGDAPAPAKLDVTKDKEECLRNGPLLSDEYVVDPKTKGVRWVVVWLIDASGEFKNDIPVKPALKALTTKTVEIDRPCCKFEPHIVCLRDGQTLIAKNSGGVTHNIKIDSFGANPSVNPLLPPGGSKAIGPWAAEPSPAIVGCGIHPWMTGRIWTFKHPYFAVTNEKGEFEIKDAPAGKFNIVVWHESGWISKGLKKGDPIEIKANDVTEVKYELKPKDKD